MQDSCLRRKSLRVAQKMECVSPSSVITPKKKSLSSKQILGVQISATSYSRPVNDAL